MRSTIHLIMLNFIWKNAKVMATETKSNLSQIFRQHDLRLNVDPSNYHVQNKQAPTLKTFSLRATANPFVTNNSYALQLDEII